MPQDQIFDAEDLEYDPRNQEQHAPPPKKRIKPEPVPENIVPIEEVPEIKQESPKNEESTSQNFDIDNPYLAATKLPAKGND